MSGSLLGGSAPALFFSPYPPSDSPRKACYESGVTPENLIDLQVETRDGIARITLDRPQSRNAYSDGMIESLCAALEALDRDPAVKVAVLSGAGPCFSAGGDLKAMRDRSGMFQGDPVTLRTRYVQGIQKISRRVAEFEKPLIAAVNGPAIGAGLDLACMCDLRIASNTAKFGSTFVNVGLIPGDGGALFLSRIVGLPHALELILTGKVIDAARALEIHLVHELADPETLEEIVMERARAIANKPSWAARLAKRLCYRAHTGDLANALDMAAAFQGLVQHHPDHDGAVQHLLDSIKPSKPPHST